MDLIFVLFALGAALTGALSTDAPVAPPAEAVEVAPAPPAPVVPEPQPAPDIAQPPEPAPELAPGGDPAQFSAEDQMPSGKFTTAGEIRMILDATQGSWVALRDYGGQDLLYFTQLLAWRCGLHQISYAINDDAAQVLDTEPCYIDTGQPNAIKAETIQPYLAFPAGSVQSVTITLLYDDLGMATAQFARTAILMP